MSTFEPYNPDQQIYKGWMVLGIVTGFGTPKPCAVPVLATSSSAAMSLAAEAHVDFQPVGIMSEDELIEHLNAIGQHRVNTGSTTLPQNAELRKN